MSDDRIESNELGIDDVFIHNASQFRLERMSDTTFWICCYKKNRPDEDRIVFWANVVDGKLIITKEQ